MADSWTELYIEGVRDTALDSLESLKTVALDDFDVWWNNNQGPIDSGFALSSEFLADWNPPVLPDIPEFIQQTEFEELTVGVSTNYVWDTSGEQQVYNAIWNIINEQGVGLSQNLQDSIFNADRERKLQTLNDSIFAIAAKYGARGFRYPSSIVANAQNEVILKYQMDLENQSREITKLMEEHARTNIQFAVSQGIDFEKFHSDFSLRYSQLFVELEKAAVELYVEKVKAEIASFEARIRALTAQVELSKVEAEYTATMGNLLIAKYKADIDQEVARSSLTLDEYKANFAHKLTALSGYASGAAGILQSVSSSYLTVNRES